MFSWSRLKKEIIDSELKFLLAVSGGVDSMVLWNFFQRCIPADRYTVAHLNHKSRDNDDLDQNLIIDVHKNSDPSHTPYIGTASGLRNSKNFENEARKQRWTFLQAVALDQVCDVIVTAHHKNDLIETYILQAMMRGVPAPYSVMNKLIEVDGFYRYKPFLPLTKRQIYNAAKRFEIRYNEDETNLDQNYERNFIRHSIIPLMMTKRNVLKTIPRAINSFSNGVELHDVKAELKG